MPAQHGLQSPPSVNRGQPEVAELLNRRKDWPSAGPYADEELQPQCAEHVATSPFANATGEVMAVDNRTTESYRGSATGYGRALGHS